MTDVELAVTGIELAVLGGDLSVVPAALARLGNEKVAPAVVVEILEDRVLPVRFVPVTLGRSPIEAGLGGLVGEFQLPLRHELVSQESRLGLALAPGM